ncbi:MAG: VOC family protein [Leptolyngbyaceae cyanobacterium RU_5_1]|nr:VOC family protein [Leptolyngbyaceae cyanobacterium RU_5_1]
MVNIITPHLTVRNADAAIAFYKQAFGAEEKFRLPTPDGSAILHATLKIGASTLFLNDEFPDMGSVAPVAGSTGSPVTIHLQVDDADAWLKRAVDAGATVTMPLDNMFWGDRYGTLVDPFGHHWAIATQVEEVAPEELNRRAAAMFAS